MNRLFFMVGITLLLIMPQAWGTMTQYPDPERQTIWNNLTDSIHTLGQTPQQAKVTKRHLHSARAQARKNSINEARRKTKITGNNR